jgi:hypothetical protein
MSPVGWSIVHTSLELDDHASARAVKVNDEPVKHMLPPEFQAEDATVTQMCRKHCPANSPFVPPLPKGEGDRG